VTTRAHKTKAIRPLSTTLSGGKIVSPTKELRSLKEGYFLIVDDAKSRHHFINAANRLNIPITTRRTKDGRYEVHRVKKAEPTIFEYTK